MGLFVSTTGTSVVIPELGITITHPATDQDLSSQFSSESLQYASTLTSVIRAGTLVWRKTAGGAIQAATDYDADFVETETMNVGPGLKNDRLVSFKDLGSGTLPSKAGEIAAVSFLGTPRKYSVVFQLAYSSTNYAIAIDGSDARFWSFESRLTTGFTINSHANQALTGPVTWSTTFEGETS